MAQKRKPDQSKIIREAALSHADKVGWGGLSMEDVARKAKLGPAAVAALFPDTWDILLQVLTTLEEDARRDAGETEGEPWRDALFEALMARFDLMEAHRGAFSSLPRAFAGDPKAVRRFARPFCRSMKEMLRRAGAPATPLHAAALGALTATLFETWRNDDTPDLARTMAAADKRLALFERVLGCGKATDN